MNHPHDSTCHCLADAIKTSAPDKTLPRPTSSALWALAVLLLALTTSPAAAATIEYLTGRTVECTVLSKDDKTVTVEITVDGKTVKRVLQLSAIHKVVIGDKTYVINEKKAAAEPKPAEPAPGKTRPMPAAPARPGGGANRVSKAEVEKLINDQGRQPPDWFNDTPLDYPKSLDLSWPPGPPAGGWNHDKNVGQYIWDIINPNQNKWREGLKLMHHLLTMHKDDPEKRTRIMTEIGSMYFRLHSDHARAAFWWRQAGVDKGATTRTLMHLAECYWRLGNKDMALEILSRRDMTEDGVKLLGDMGDTARCIQLATQALPTSPHPPVLHLIMGDAFRVAGDLDKALAAYRKASETAANNPKLKGRADASADAIRFIEKFDLGKVADGTYKGSSLGYEAQVEVEVVVANHRIESVRITNHREKQFYSALTDTPAKILAKQGVKGVDATSGATLTSEAIINGTAKAIGGK